MPSVKQKKTATKSKTAIAIAKSMKRNLVHVEQVEVNDIVLCRMRGFCEWPAKIIRIENGAINVEFFGDHTTHVTSLKNVFEFGNIHSAELMRSNLKGRKNPLLKKAIREAEVLLGIPDHISIAT